MGEKQLVGGCAHAGVRAHVELQQLRTRGPDTQYIAFFNS